MPTTTRDRCRLYYEVGGTPGAPRLVLIRGLGRSGRYWGPVVPELEQDFELLVVDNRGVGRSDAPRPPYSTAMLADDVVATMDHATWGHAHVFGISLGGMVAQQLALRHPDRVDRLVLGCTTPGGSRAASSPLTSAVAIVRAAVAGGDRGLDILLPLLVSDTALRKRPDIRAAWQVLGRTERRSIVGVLGQLAAARSHDVHARLSAVTAPTLVITGDSDQLIPPTNSRLIASAIPGATYATLPGARHDFTTDCPAESAAAIRRFLTR